MSTKDMGRRGTGRYDADIGGSFATLFKSDQGFVVWGPASVEVVDREGDIVEASALEDALPQLLKRARLSLEHSDQIVGEILKGVDTSKPVTVEVNGQEYTRSEFPTDVLYPDEDGVPEKGLYVCGAIYDDSQQSRETRKRIESGELDSFSISGEAISTTTQFDSGGDAIDRIEEVDLSAFTLCQNGMNQEAKFALIDKNQSYSYEELAENLPDDLLEQVKDHLSDPEMKGDSEDVMDVDGEQEVEEVREDEEAEDEDGNPVDKMFTPYSHSEPTDIEVEDRDVSGALEEFYEGVGR